VRVVLVCHAATAATRRAAFPADEPVEPAGPRLATLAARLPRVDRAVRGSSLRCRQTAEALGLAHARADSRLAACDFGRWVGYTLDEVLVAEPAAVRHWLADPTAAPHGGESLLDVQRRVAGWLDNLGDRSVLAVSDPTVIRAAVVHALGAGAACTWRLDVAPLSRAELRGGPGRWTLRRFGR
jgi:broad specificity phosphatase PhoE